MLKQKKNFSPIFELSYNKGYEIPSKQVALHPNWLKPTSHNPDIKRKKLFCKHFTRTRFFDEKYGDD